MSHTDLNPSALDRLCIYRATPTAKTFQLIHEGHVLDANKMADWMLAGRCLRYAEDTMPPTGLNRFQVWVNWTEQRAPLDQHTAIDIPGMAALWEDLRLKAIGETLTAEMLPSIQLTDAERMMAKPAPRESVQLKMKRLHEEAIVPTFGTDGAACFDLYAITEFDGEAYINSTAMANVTVETGWAFEVPEGWVMKVYSRSGQGFKDNTRLANCVGIIDSDYRGPLRVKLTRDDGKMLFVRHGDRVAQAMLERVPVVEFIEVDELGSTDRGERGYGSTGR